jgi:hypothetical protein
MARADHSPPLDRPTPPPCCADGVCYPNPTTWGVYPTRWRRWPGVTDAPLEPSPAPAPGELGPEVPPYEAPPAEEEERRAPPPTQQRRPVEAPPEGEAAPGTQPTTPPEGATPPTGPFNLGPTMEESPTDEDSLRMPWDEPTSDVDPPPAPPFASIHAAPAARRSSQPTTPTLLKPATARRPSAPAAYDPPPPLPLALN